MSNAAKNVDIQFEHFT